MFSITSATITTGQMKSFIVDITLIHGLPVEQMIGDICVDNDRYSPHRKNMEQDDMIG